jgi:hypothetical protein
MSNSFKYLPWTLLLQSAGITVLIATVLDILFFMGIGAFPIVEQIITNIPLLPLVLTFAVPFGIGALAVVITTHFFRQILLRAETLWALIACVLLFLLIKGWLPNIPTVFVQPINISVLMMVVVGCFTAGRRYWR